MKCGCDDCFKCPYRDCILPDPEDKVKNGKDAAKRRQAGRNGTYYDMNRDRLSKASLERYRANRDEICRKRREAYRRRKMCQLECHWCHKDLNEPRDVIKYKRKYFCDEKCLGEYLVDQAEGEFEVVWHDTPENMKICAEEAKHEY